MDAVQGVVPGFATPFQHVAGVRFADGDAGRRWLGRWAVTVGSLAEVMNQDRRPEVLAVSGHDVLVGQAPVRRCAFRGSGGATEPVTASARWIVPTGGGYFFGPSLPALRARADGADLS